MAVILYYRRGPELVRTLEALRSQTVPPRQMVVVDNASGDGVLEDLASRGELHDVELLELEQNVGYGGGMNLGAARAAPAKRLLFLTHEVWLRSDCVESLLTGQARAGAVAVGPALSLPSGATWSFGGSLTKSGRTVHRLAGDDPHPVRWLDGACVLADTATFHALGGFAEDYFLYWEDVDFGLRAREMGPIACVEDARAVQSTSMTPAYYAVRNRLLCWRRHRRRDLLVASMLEVAADLLFRRIPFALVHWDWAGVRVRARALRDGLFCSAEKGPAAPRGVRRG